MKVKSEDFLGSLEEFEDFLHALKNFWKTQKMNQMYFLCLFRLQLSLFPKHNYPSTIFETLKTLEGQG